MILFPISKRGYNRDVNIFGGGYIFINKFCEHIGGRVHFYLPHPLAPVTGSELSKIFSGD
jgi:hypothetical protein